MGSDACGQRETSDEESESYVKVKEPYIVKRSDPVQKEFTETYEVTGIPYINTNYDSSINENTIFSDILTNKKVEYLLFRYLDYFLRGPIGSPDCYATLVEDPHGRYLT